MKQQPWENIRIIGTASVVYNSTFSNGYPPSIATLGGTGPLRRATGLFLFPEILRIRRASRVGTSLHIQVQDGNALLGAGCGPRVQRLSCVRSSSSPRASQGSEASAAIRPASFTSTSVVRLQRTKSPATLWKFFNSSPPRVILPAKMEASQPRIPHNVHPGAQSC